MACLRLFRSNSRSWCIQSFGKLSQTGVMRLLETHHSENLIYRTFVSISSPVCLKNSKKSYFLVLPNWRKNPCNMNIMNFLHLFRNCSYGSIDSGSQIPRNEGSLKEVYHFKHIKFVRALSMLKIYQTLLTVLCTPPMMFMASTGIIDTTEFAFNMTLMTLAIGMLALMSHFIRHIVCIMYMDPCKKTVEISHLTFWCRRKDVYLDLSDIIPLTDTGQKTTDAYVRLDTYDKKHTFYLFLKYGEIADKDNISQILGELK